MKVIKMEDVARVYSGRPGCACGCKGDYKDSPKAITRMVNKFNKNLIDVVEGGNNLSIENDTRLNILYLKDEKENAYAEG